MPDRPAQSPSFAGTQNGISAYAATIAIWLGGLASMKLLGFAGVTEVPQEVSFAAKGIVLFGLPWVIGYAGAHMRNSEFAKTGEVTGVKKLM